jgi:hypothetical protein
MVDFNEWFATLLCNGAQLSEGNQQFLLVLGSSHHVVSYIWAILMCTYSETLLRLSLQL